MRVRSWLSAPPLVWSIAAAFLASTSGCLSHEHRISSQELARLVDLPPDARGARVRVVQQMGERRGETVEPGAPGTEPYGHSHVEWNVHVSGSSGGDGATPSPSGGAGQGWRGEGGAPSRGGGAGQSWRGGGPAKPSGGSPASSWKGGGMSVPSSGGGADELIVLAVIVFAVAALAAAGLAITEGLRFDGDMALHPAQPVHLQTAGGQERTVPLGALAAQDLVQVEHALVMDDEGPGLRPIARAPLDRRGFAFKLHAGLLEAPFEEYGLTGLASDIQIGFFPHQRVGVLAGVSLTGGTDALSRSFARHSFGLELQTFPLQLWRLHLGPFVNGGQVVAGDDEGTRSGPGFGGGVMLEVDLTTRLALSARAGWTRARLDPGAWSDHMVVTFGLAVH